MKHSITVVFLVALFTLSIPLAWGQALGNIEITDRPILVLSANSISMGTSAVGISKTDTFTISNTGNIDLTISSIAVSDTHFVVNPTSATIAVSGSKIFTITFNPDTNTYAANIIISSNTTKLLDTVAVSAIGYLKMSAAHQLIVNAGTGLVGVSMQGVITRTMGSYFRFQDSTGGGMIYLSTSAFKDSVTSGYLKAGSVVYVKGYAKNYSNLQELYSVASFKKIKDDTVPAPVVLTLAQLIANAESYESMLIQLKSVSTTSTGTFAANTNYALTDATSSTGEIKMYLNTGSSSLIGTTTIPTSAFDLTGIVTQYSTTYEVTPVLTTDVQTVTGVEASKTTIPKSYELSNNYPNPFNPSTTVSFGLPSQSHVMVKVYSILGQEVATLMDGVQEAGYHNAVWNGKNSSGMQAASGVYLLRVMAQSTSGNATFSQVRKMILLK
jgi:hypothetical protein